MSDDDDYMNMIIEEPTKKETFTQKKRREQREVPTHSPCSYHCLPQSQQPSN